MAVSPNLHPTTTTTHYPLPLQLFTTTMNKIVGCLVIPIGGVFAMGCVVAHHVPSLPNGGILQFGVPWFFFVSGFWMGFKFLDYDGNAADIWKQECARRVRTLIVPYFLWNLIWFPVLFVANWLGWRYCGAERIVDGSTDCIVRCLGLSMWQWPALVPTWFLRSLFVASVIVGGVWALLGVGRRFGVKGRIVVAAAVFWGLWFLMEKIGPSGIWWEGFFCFGIPVFGMACFSTGGVIASFLRNRPESGCAWASFIRRQMMPVYLLHVPVILMISWIARAVGVYQYLIDVKGCVLLGGIGVIGAIVVGKMMRLFLPKVTYVLFGGR